jgi:hypothetical protein
VVLATGARQGELLGLRGQDVDLENCSIRIERTLPKVAGEALQQEKKRQNDTRLNAAHWSADFGELVFTNGSGRPMEPSLLGKDLSLELEMAASLLAFTGVPARVAMEVSATARLRQPWTSTPRSTQGSAGGGRVGRFLGHPYACIGMRDQLYPVGSRRTGVDQPRALDN